MKILNNQNEIIFEEPVDTVVKFLKAKNLLCRNVGATIDLTPENQIKEVEIKEKLTIKNNNASMCPYCGLYYEDDCKGCPMYEAGNSCNDIGGSTYHRVCRETNQATYAKIPQMHELVDEFNSLYFKDMD